MKTIFFILLLLVVGCNSNSSGEQAVSERTEAPIGGTPTETPTPSSWTEEFVDLVNAHRAKLGLRALIHREEMAQIAREHSQNMANKTVAFGHTGFSERCSHARSALGGGNWCAENVAMGQKTPQAAFNSWINSSGHRANIESSRATHMGFGYAKNAAATYYWTQLFLEL